MKSIDLDFRVWEKLAEKSKELDCTLSDTIEYLLSESNKTEQASRKVLDLKHDLHELLDLE